MLAVHFILRNVVKVEMEINWKNHILLIPINVILQESRQTGKKSKKKIIKILSHDYFSQKAFF
jgi:hypothetical protein